MQTWKWNTKSIAFHFICLVCFHWIISDHRSVGDCNQQDNFLIRGPSYSLQGFLVLQGCVMSFPETCECFLHGSITGCQRLCRRLCTSWIFHSSHLYFFTGLCQRSPLVTHLHKDNPACLSMTVIHEEPRWQGSAEKAISASWHAVYQQ